MPARRMHGEKAMVVSKRRVLVADDEDTVLTVTCRVFERMGFECVSCADGQQAVELLAEHGGRLDLVVLDMTMPKLSGDQVLAELRRHDTTTPVIIMSGYSASETSPQLIAQGPTHFIQKPFSPKDLRSCAMTMVEHDGNA
jgi:DNA-binding NtrC family response regulator